MSLAHVHTPDGLTDAREQPRCTGCGHRRIMHYRGTLGGRHQRVLTEIETPCSMPVDGWPCGCDTYQPLEYGLKLA